MSELSIYAIAAIAAISIVIIVICGLPIMLIPMMIQVLK